MDYIDTMKKDRELCLSENIEEIDKNLFLVLNVENVTFVRNLIMTFYLEYVCCMLRRLKITRLGV